MGLYVGNVGFLTAFPSYTAACVTLLIPAVGVASGMSCYTWPNVRPFLTPIAVFGDIGGLSQRATILVLIVASACPIPGQLTSP